ncbi:hypothetical protein NSB25_25815 [Acetatifactor muris]|uniref:Uncharacterized protein n=1 Tax=Acetatifactor muris TaxID=879566 RepID=A0A2K4ZPA5_9FIRM|nr:hypothetical protein [Acetatifactor muris]MCR2050654.1 hypothetical protein [Acetatifactor muris]SOY32202.1 hypothetical protein AMURIS_04960 [Acetatifactor muris]
MAQVIKNLGQFAKALEPKIIATLEAVAEDTKQEIDDHLQAYYDEYDPALRKLLGRLFYQRTYQLKDCCKIGKPTINNGKISIEVYLDIDSLHYDTKGADAFKTVVAANSSLHGGWDVSNLQSGQVPWSVIKNNDGTSYGNGIQIWEDPIHELIDNGKLITIFKKHAKARGLNLK